MNISGSSIAAYYSGNAALALDNEAARQDISVHQHKMQGHRQRAAPGEQMLEGELLNHQTRQKANAAKGDAIVQQRDSSDPEQDGRGRGYVSPEGGSYYQKALNQYQNNAQLDGFTSLDPLHQVDIYV